MNDLFVKNLMTKQVICTSPEAELIGVIRTMLDHRYSCMVVVKDRVPVGIITERDIVRLLAEFMNNRQVISVQVSDIMSAPIITVTGETTLYEALVITAAQMLRHLPVVNERGELEGIVTLSDLAQAHFQVYEKQREMIEKSITTRTRELLEANEQLTALSMVDGLLGIGNRRAMEVDLEHTHAQALRYRRSYAVALFDVDFFKLYNDHYGHLSGDNALKEVAEHLKRSIRKSDRLYRYGGEEILMLLPETPLYGAEILAKRIIRNFYDLGIPHCKSPRQVLTMSCGIACQAEGSSHHNSWIELISLADRGLYVSKQNGRNQVTAMHPFEMGHTLMQADSSCLMMSPE